MTGRRILFLLCLLAAAAVTYTVWPSDRDLDRRYAALEDYRTETVAALTEANDLVRYFDALKPAAKKKQELVGLRQRSEELDRTARSFRDQAGVEHGDARRGLEGLEQQAFDLMRDCQDLVARLRAMKSFKEVLDPIQSQTGQLTHRLLQIGETNTDVDFAQRVTLILEDSRTARSLSADGQQQLSTSIVQGRTICEAARKKLLEVNKGLRELILEGGGELPAELLVDPSGAPGDASSGDAGAALGNGAPSQGP